MPRGRGGTGAELLDLAREYLAADKERRNELEEWLQEGAPLKDGRCLVTRDVVDRVLHSCEKPISGPMVIDRYDSGSMLTPGSWISTTTAGHEYEGTKRSWALPAGTRVVDTAGLADAGEFILSTDVLIALDRRKTEPEKASPSSAAPSGGLNRAKLKLLVRSVTSTQILIGFIGPELKGRGDIEAWKDEDAKARRAHAADLLAEELGRVGFRDLATAVLGPLRGPERPSRGDIHWEIGEWVSLGYTTPPRRLTKEDIARLYEAYEKAGGRYPTSVPKAYV